MSGTVVVVVDDRNDSGCCWPCRGLLLLLISTTIVVDDHDGCDDKRSDGGNEDEGGVGRGFTPRLVSPLGKVKPGKSIFPSGFFFSSRSFFHPNVSVASMLFYRASCLSFCPSVTFLIGPSVCGLMSFHSKNSVRVSEETRPIPIPAYEYILGSQKLEKANCYKTD